MAERSALARQVAFDIEDPVLAAAAWSRIAEPGDPSAGAVLAALGAVGALAWLIDPACVGAPVEEQGASSRRALARWQPRLEGLRPDRDVATIVRLGGTVVHAGQRLWPSGLADLGAAAPVCLWVRGDAGALAEGLLDAGGVALVGARAATAYGEHVTSELASGLAGRGHVVWSGGAFGIDAVAHRASLAAGGPTVAVLAGGLDRLYPAANADLLQAVADRGAVVSEMPPGGSPTRSRFLQRNRLIAALARVCVVVEAGWRSGALSTAGHAARLLRPVGAVPGPVMSASSAGCHRLLREQDAVCVTGVDDVEELIGPLGSVGPAPEPPRRTADAPPGVRGVDAAVWEALPVRGAAQLDSLVRAAGLSVPEVRASLARLELWGHASQEGERFRRLAPPR